MLIDIYEDLMDRLEKTIVAWTRPEKGADRPGLGLAAGRIAPTITAPDARTRCLGFRPGSPVR
jgi:hypothetical protein